MMDGERLVKDYLDRLADAARPLATGRRRELVDEVREHIETDLARMGRHDEATVRNILERLGSPDAIVAVELDVDRRAPEAVMSLSGLDRDVGVWEVLAILLLTVGAVVVPIFAPAVGLAFTWVSTRWSRRTKLVITAVALLVLILPFALVIQASSQAVPTP